METSRARSRRWVAESGGPLPEIVDLGRWEVEESPGDGRVSWVAFDLGARRGGKMCVPFGGGERERYLRAHELAHTAWTPRDPFPEHLPETTIQHAEDARIGRRLAGIGRPATVRVISDDEIAAIATGLAEGNLATRDVASQLLAAFRTPDGAELAKAVARVDPSLPAIAGEVWATTIGREEWPEFECAVAAAELLVSRFPPDGVTRKRRDPLGRLGRLLGLGRSAPSGRTAGTKLPAAAAAGGDSEDGVGWGSLQVVEYPRPLRLPTRIAGVRARPAADGIRIGDPSRFYRDGHGWRERQRRRHAGGAVLIDCSGSMQLTPEILEQLVVANPAAIIATYSGDDDKEGGRLHIVAKGGRRVRPEHARPPGMCNVVDGPALAWLASQRGPLAWVSDGRVTGRGEVPSAALREEVEELCRSNRIRRIETAAALIGEWHDRRR